MQVPLQPVPLCPHPDLVTRRQHSPARSLLKDWLGAKQFLSLAKGRAQEAFSVLAVALRCLLQALALSCISTCLR
jgi:hypothetical protein